MRHRGRADCCSTRSGNNPGRFYRGPPCAVRLCHARRPLVVEALAAEATTPATGARDTGSPRDGAALTRSTGSHLYRGAGGRRRCSTGRSLRAGDRIAGPALIREANATTVIEPGWTAEVTALDHMLLRRTEPRRRASRRAARRPDPVLLELFNNLFMNVAEQTGAVLQNTSHERQHQGAAGFFLRHLRRRRQPGGQRAARSGASRCDGRERADRSAATGAAG